MTQFVFTPMPAPSLPITGSDQRFPIARVFCLGRNYPWGDAKDQVREFARYFMKPASSVVEARGDVAFPPQTEEFCYEVELVVAIGKGGTRIAEDQALEHVWGYAVGLDLTRRDLQKAAMAAGQPWEAGKAFDGSAPITPITPVSQMGHPHEGAIWLHVNDVPRQQATLQSQFWSVAQIISRLSQSVQLNSGDLIMTGTPPGVGALQPGDCITAGIDGIDQLSMRVGARPLA